MRRRDVLARAAFDGSTLDVPNSSHNRAEFDGRYQFLGALSFGGGLYVVFGALACGIFLLVAGAFTILDQIPRRIPR